MARATIVVPTHDHHATLPMAVGSALRQTVGDLEVLIVGDGVTERVRAAARQLEGVDPRVRLLDLPKGPHHGEVHRGTAIQEARSAAIFYLCDDDLLLPRHVENLLELLEHADLVQARNGYVEVTGELRLFPADLADPETVRWHLREPRRNLTSLTGTAHTRRSYLDLPEGWTTTPPDEWPDHYMWKKFFRVEGFRGATHPDMTALQWPTSSGREGRAQEDRAAELAGWFARLDEPRFDEWVQRWAAEAARRELALSVRGAVDLLHEREALLREQERQRDELRRLSESAEEDRARLEHLWEELARAREQAMALAAQLDLVASSRSWRITRPARRLAERARSGRSRRP